MPPTGSVARWASGVLGLERFELDHVNGASADHSRIIRLSYHRPDYVRLAKRAYETWAEVERDAGERIVTVTGGLDLWPADPAIPMADYTDSLTAGGRPVRAAGRRRGAPPLAAVAGRRRAARDVAGARAAWPTRSAAMPRTGALPERTARRCATAAR